MKRLALASLAALAVLGLAAAGAVVVAALAGRRRPGTT